MKNSILLTIIFFNVISAISSGQLVGSTDNSSVGYRQSKYFELFGSATLNNSYLIGTAMQKWMNDDIGSGSPAFYNVGFANFSSLNESNTSFLGVGFSINIPPSHSIWGSNLYYGGRNELVLNPYILSVGIPYRYAFRPSGFSLTLDPSLLMSVLTGKYSTNGNITIDGKNLTGTFSTNMGSMGIGFGLGLGAEYHFGFFGLGVKYGMRFLNSAVYFNDDSVGAWSPTDSNKNNIKLNLGGSYLSVGIMLKINKKD